MGLYDCRLALINADMFITAFTAEEIVEVRSSALSCHEKKEKETQVRPEFPILLHLDLHLAECYI